MTVDLASLDTGIGLRDDHMRERHLETDEFPHAVLAGGDVIAASAPALAVGEPIAVTVRGSFDLHGVARDREIAGTATLQPDGSLLVQAEFTVSLAAHGIDRPGFLVMKLADEQQVRVTLTCRPEGAP